MPPSSGTPARSPNMAMTSTKNPVTQRRGSYTGSTGSGNESDNPWATSPRAGPSSGRQRSLSLSSGNSLIQSGYISVALQILLTVPALCYLAAVLGWLFEDVDIEYARELAPFSFAILVVHVFAAGEMDRLTMWEVLHYWVHAACEVLVANDYTIKLGGGIPGILLTSLLMLLFWPSGYMLLKTMRRKLAHSSRDGFPNVAEGALWYGFIMGLFSLYLGAQSVSCLVYEGVSDCALKNAGLRHLNYSIGTLFVLVMLFKHLCGISPKQVVLFRLAHHQSYSVVLSVVTTTYSLYEYASLGIPYSDEWYELLIDLVMFTFWFLSIVTVIWKAPLVYSAPIIDLSIAVRDVGLRLEALAHVPTGGITSEIRTQLRTQELQLEEENDVDASEGGGEGPNSPETDEGGGREGRRSGSLDRRGSGSGSEPLSPPLQSRDGSGDGSDRVRRPSWFKGAYWLHEEHPVPAPIDEGEETDGSVFEEGGETSLRRGGGGGEGGGQEEKEGGRGNGVGAGSSGGSGGDGGQGGRGDGEGGAAAATGGGGEERPSRRRRASEAVERYFAVREGEYEHPLIRYYRVSGKLPSLSIIITYLSEIIFFWRFLLFVLTVGYKLFLSLAAYYLLDRHWAELLTPLSTTGLVVGWLLTLGCDPRDRVSNQAMNVHFWFHALSEIPEVIVWIRVGNKAEVIFNALLFLVVWPWVFVAYKRVLQIMREKYQEKALDITVGIFFESILLLTVQFYLAFQSHGCLVHHTHDEGYCNGIIHGNLVSGMNLVLIYLVVRVLMFKLGDMNILRVLHLELKGFELFVLLLSGFSVCVSLYFFANRSIRLTSVGYVRQTLEWVTMVCWIITSLIMAYRSTQLSHMSQTSAALAAGKLSMTDLVNAQQQIKDSKEFRKKQSKERLGLAGAAGGGGGAAGGFTSAGDAAYTNGDGGGGERTNGSGGGKQRGRTMGNGEDPAGSKEEEEEEEEGVNELDALALALAASRRGRNNSRVASPSRDGGNSSGRPTPVPSSGNLHAYLENGVEGGEDGIIPAGQYPPSEEVGTEGGAGGAWGTERTVEKFCCCVGWRRLVQRLDGDNVGNNVPIIRLFYMSPTLLYLGLMVSVAAGVLQRGYATSVVGVSFSCVCFHWLISVENPTTAPEVLHLLLHALAEAVSTTMWLTQREWVKALYTACALFTVYPCLYYGIQALKLSLQARFSHYHFELIRAATAIFSRSIVLLMGVLFLAFEGIGCLNAAEASECTALLYANTQLGLSVTLGFLVFLSTYVLQDINTRSFLAMSFTTSQGFVFLFSGVAFSLCTFSVASRHSNKLTEDESEHAVEFGTLFAWYAALVTLYLSRAKVKGLMWGDGDEGLEGWGVHEQDQLDMSLSSATELQGGEGARGSSSSSNIVVTGFGKEEGGEAGAAPSRAAAGEDGSSSASIGLRSRSPASRISKPVGQDFV